MSDTTPSADGIREILEALIPESGRTVTWHDVMGGVHIAPAAAPIRVQAKVAQFVQESLTELRDVFTGDASVIAFKAMTDPKVVSALVGVFELLHPRATERARRNASGLDEEARLAYFGETPIAELATEDLFSIEEVADAVLPFCAAPILKLINLMGPVAG